MRLRSGIGGRKQFCRAISMVLQLQRKPNRDEPNRDGLESTELI